MFPFSKRTRLAAAVGAAVVATGLTLAFGVSSAGAQSVAGQAKTTAPGDNGDVKIHSTGTLQTDERNEPHVCTYDLDAFNFDSVQSVTWWIKAWPPTGDGTTIVDQGKITLDSSGNGVTTPANQPLPNGHYKLFWTFDGEKGAAKHKVFWVSCPATPPTPPPSPCVTECESSSPPCVTECESSSPPCVTECESSSPPSEPPSQTPSAPPPAAPAPTPVPGTLPVTG